MLTFNHILKGLRLSFLKSNFVKSSLVSISLVSLSLITLSSQTLAFDAEVATETASETMSSLKTVSDTKRLKSYIKEGADLSSYKSITIDPVVATFKEGWLKRYNQEHKGLSEKIRDADAIEIKGRVEKQFPLTFADYLEKKAQLPLVNTPTRKTLRLKPVITDLVIHAPDILGTTSSVVMVRQVGSATLTVEIYDASSNVLLAKLISEEETRDNQRMIRTNRVVNNSEFKQVYRDWAKDLIKLLK